MSQKVRSRLRGKADVADPLYPPIEPFLRETLPVGDGHRLYYEVSGQPDGRPMLFLHGGPGSCAQPAHRRFFDPAWWRIVLFDQRGCGQSAPLGELRANDTPALLRDIEALRKALDVDRWVLFGGSWGSTLALAYAIAYPQHVAALVLRGVFLASADEVRWFLVGLRRFLPEAWRQFAGEADADPATLLADYRGALFESNDDEAAIAAARRWQAYEASVMAVGEADTGPSAIGDDVLLARVRVQLHYLLGDFFLATDWLTAGRARLVTLPLIVVQGRRDLVCPPLTAYTLAKSWPGAQLRIVAEGGHSAMHPAMSAALLQATEDIKQIFIA